MQHGMKCAARGHERDATWMLGCLRVRYIPKAYTCTANTHPSRDAGPGRGPSGARFHGSRGVPSRDGMAELEAGMMHEHGACGHIQAGTPVHACACAVHAQHLSTRVALARRDDANEAASRESFEGLDIRGVVFDVQ